MGTQRNLEWAAGWLPLSLYLYRYPGIRRLLYFISAFVMANYGDDVVSDALIPAKACPEEEISLLWYTNKIADLEKG